MPQNIPTSEAARILGLTVRQVARLVESDELSPAIRFPGVRGPMLFAPKDVERLAKSRAKAAERTKAKAS